LTTLDLRSAAGALFGCLLVALPAWVACGQSGNADTAPRAPTGSSRGLGSASSSGAGEASDSGALPPAEGAEASVDAGSDVDATVGSDAASTDIDPVDGATDASSCATGSNSTASQPGYVGDWTAGDYPADFVDAGHYLTISGVAGQMDQVRQYAVHVPRGYNRGTPVPAVFCIHGLTQTAAFCLYQGVNWPDKGDQEGFVVIMPNGYMNSWNAGTCCGGAAQAGLDDVALMRAIFADVGTHVNIDLGRVYATGFSNGGFMSYRLACEASDLFVAVAPAEGAVGTAEAGAGISELTTGLTTDFTSCAPSRKVSILDIHGTADPLVPYADQAPSLAYFQEASGCSATQQAASIPGGGGDTRCASFTGCPSCPQVEITGGSVDGGGHCWFGSPNCGTGAGALGDAIVGNNSDYLANTEAIWNFFASLSR
jgi:polyhydroxybutyrate depolymerase